MMYPLDLPDAPLVRNLSATGYPDGTEPQAPRCPVCGAECAFIYRYEDSEVVGCDICLTAADANDVPECFEDY